MGVETNSVAAPVVGRFAPSPTGPLHYGSMLAAVASFLSIRSQYGTWLLRIDDLDPPREMAGAAAEILRTLESFGLYWDGEVLYQSQRNMAYQEIVDLLVKDKLAYPCSCSRKDIEMRGETSYSGFCRSGAARKKDSYAYRLIVPDRDIKFQDMIQGPQSVNLQSTSGDFVIKRADGLFAYHLAAVIDDAAQGITEIIRGADLLPSTPAQKYLQEILGITSPSYGHVPVAVNHKGEKLSKQTGAEPVSAKNTQEILHRILVDLGQSPPDELTDAIPQETLDWAILNWKPENIPAKMSYCA